jgi:hypothetical protein
MPTFDQSSSDPDAEAALLRAVLGPARPGPTTLRLAARDYHRSRRRAMIKRALIVMTLTGGFCGSAFMMRANGPTPVVQAKRVSPADLDPVTTGSIAVNSDACRASMQEVVGRAAWTNARPCGAADKHAP